jgi:hypothetical protein
MNDQDLCDEEKSYHEWVAKNIPFIRNNKDCVKVMQQLYVAGFAAGFVHRDKINAEEQLQK